MDGWRIDVVPDVVAINPHLFELMRQAVKTQQPDALLISETWPEDQARLRVLGDEFDSTMNYRFRLAVLGFLRDRNFEDNDGGVPALTATEFEAALRGLQEDYPPAAFATAMNLLSSHDVNRAVRVLDHDGIDVAAQEPVNNFKDGRARLALAAVEEGCATRVDVPKTTAIYPDTTVMSGNTYGSVSYTHLDVYKRQLCRQQRSVHAIGRRSRGAWDDPDPGRRAQPLIERQPLL